MDFEARPLKPKIGVEILGIDLSKSISDTVMGEVRAVWLKHGVAVFPRQKLDDDQHIEFSRR